MSLKGISCSDNGVIKIKMLSIYLPSILYLLNENEDCVTFKVGSRQRKSNNSGRLLDKC